ncbi:hypothetical protein E2C01_080209 [Portunus trituberculatus]|uniref:Uncharacterized protein n=1 Tax=Portunus trituberculatus TaxID=210409 RepID=A0A5B7ISU0_PORTR|nr:hypothetical protein [Portunus trituberculatus]
MLGFLKEISGTSSVKPLLATLPRPPASPGLPHLPHYGDPQLSRSIDELRPQVDGNIVAGREFQYSNFFQLSVQRQ